MRSKHHDGNRNSARKRLATPAPLVTRRASPTKPHFVLEHMGTVAVRSSSPVSYPEV